MLKELFSYVAELGKASAALEIVELPGKKMAIYNRLSGSMTTYAQNNFRRHVVADLESLKRSAEIYAGAQTGRACAWIGDEYVCLVLDDAELRRDQVHLTLEFSELFRELQKFPKQFTQRELVLFCKRYLPLEHRLLRQVRNIDFTRHSNGRKTFEHGRESLGSSVEAAVQGVEGLDQEYSIHLDVYDNVVSSAVDLVVRVDIDCENQRFCLFCSPGQPNRALRQARQRIQVELDDVPEIDQVFCGYHTRWEMTDGVVETEGSR